MKKIRRSDFYYDLPEALIAQYPSVERTASRLLSLEGATGKIEHRQFAQISELLKPGDLLIFNNTRVMPARLYGCKASGGQLELLIERILSPQHVLTHIKSNRAPKPNSRIMIAEYEINVLTQHENGLFELKLNSAETTFFDIMQQHGHIPLPPYIDRDDETLDQSRYQTVYAQHEGAVAAPTAGLHFDQALLTQLKNLNIEMGFVTLHVGAGTFRPVKTEYITDHVMHSEYCEVSSEVCQQIEIARARGGRVIAVGTTSVRALESAVAKSNGLLRPYRGDTDIFIYSADQFHVIDALITNFHLPESTLLMLVCAFAGYEQVMQAYRIAIEQSYRFFSYGDAMFIIR